jgi:LemA protein
VDLVDEVEVLVVADQAINSLANIIANLYYITVNSDLFLIFVLMKKVWIIVIVIVVLFALWIWSKYNTLVGLDESVKTSWSQVENVYQRRADLVPNLVNVVKWAAAQESGVLIWVTQARANATKLTVSVDDAQSLAKYQKAQWELSQALGKLLAITENYPQLQSIQAFRDLSVQLEGTENRISVERMNFNTVAKTYNIAVRRFPANIVAGLFRFDPRPLFEAVDGAEVAPKVEF